MSDDKDQWFTPKQIRERLKISDSTLRRWANEHRVKYITPVSDHRLYSYSSIIMASGGKTENSGKAKYCYCRVSSAKQKDDLKRQEEFMRKQYPNSIIISDIGSGINWKRSNFRKMVGESIHGKVSEIIVAHRDRLCRFGFELLEYIFTASGTKLVVLNGDEQKSTSDELAEDLLAIIRIFNCRQMGKRRYVRKTGETTDKSTGKVR